MNSGKIEIISMERYLADGEKYYIEYNHVNVFYRPHLHRFFEIEFITGGSGYEEIDGKMYEIEKGDVAIMVPNEVHSYVCKNGQSLEITSIKVSPHFLKEEAAIVTSSLLVKKLSASDYALIELLCSKVSSYSEDSAQALSYHIIRECIGLVFLMCLAHKNESAIQLMDDSESDRYRRALLYIHKNFRRNLTVAEVAAEVYLAPNYFSSYFKKNMGMSCSRYINKLRLELAYEYIMATDMPLKEIFYRCGFRSFAYFSNVFKDYYGYAPGYYRKNRKNVIQREIPVKK